MKAWIIDSPDMLGRLELADIEIEPPAYDEIQVRLHAVSLNSVDHELLEQGHSSWAYPHVLGVDGAGVVSAVGDQVVRFQVGDRVFFHASVARNGTFAEYANVRAIAVALIPEGISFTSAAALPYAALTAYQAIHRKLRVQVGERVLIHGGSGGVGSFALQFAKHKGAAVITTCSPDACDYVQGLGADASIDERNEDIAARILELTGDGLHSVLNTISGESATADLPLLKYNGQLAFTAGAPDYSRVSAFGQALSFHEVALGGAYLSADVDAQRDLGQMGREVAELLARGVIKDCITHTLPFEHIPQGLEMLKHNHVRGKIVCTLPQPAPTPAPSV